MMTEDASNSDRQAGSPAIFLDRDGVIVVPEFRDGRSFAPRHYADFRLYDDIEPCLLGLKNSGFLLIVVTNQPDVGRGLIQEETLERMHHDILRKLPIDDIRTCRHTRDDNCSCRKPRSGLLINAAQEHGIALERSFMIGDRSSDIEAGQAAGCRTIFIDLKYETEAPPKNPDWSARSLQEAAAIIGLVTKAHHG